MNHITAVRAELRAWAASQPDPIRGQAETIARNLKGLRREPHNEPLIAQTKANIARLEKAMRSIQTAMRQNQK